MSFEHLPQTPPVWEQDARQEQRTLHDAELIRGGAKAESGTLLSSSEQMDQMRAEMQADLFDGTPEEAILTSRIEVLDRLRHALRFYFDAKRGPLSGEPREQLDAGYQRGLRLLSLSRPASRQEGQELLAQVEAQLDAFSAAYRILEANSKLRIGNTVNVLRSSGSVEPGWQIKAITPEAAFIIEEPQQNLQKTLPIAELAQVN